MASFKEKVFGFALKKARAIPAVKKKVTAEIETALSEMEASLKPYKESREVMSQLPQQGKRPEEVINVIKDLKEKEEGRWQQGLVSGAVYHGEPEHIEFLNEAYALNSQTNPLHGDIWPRITKFESEIVSMTAHMLNAKTTESNQEVCGVVSSGGSESILLAMKAYRDWAKETKGITEPELIVPTSVHAAFMKAAQYFKIKLIQVPVGKDYKADVKATEKKITKNTICIVGSSPSFPLGVIDPIEELSELARKHNVGFHTDACLGGFLLPWIKKNGHEVPKFGFELEGVTSMSVDTHKYGYAPKGSSVVLYRSPELRHHMYFKIADWQGGLYLSPTFAGSRSGALIAACWAALVKVGEDGYLNAAEKIYQTAQTLRKGVENIEGLSLLGDSPFLVAFGANAKIDIYRVMELMDKRGWNLNGLQYPASVHLCVTLPHTQQGVSARFLKDLSESTAEAERAPRNEKGTAPVYGMATGIPDKTLVEEFMDNYLDRIHRI